MVFLWSVYLTASVQDCKHPQSTGFITCLIMWFHYSSGAAHLAFDRLNLNIKSFFIIQWLHDYYWTTTRMHISWYQLYTGRQSTIWVGHVLGCILYVVTDRIARGIQWKYFLCLISIKIIIIIFSTLWILFNNNIIIIIDGYIGWTRSY